MAYEPKVGDEVVLRGTIEKWPGDWGQEWATLRVDGTNARYNFPASVLRPVPDLGEAELRGEVGGPWAIALSEIQDRIEKRVEALEASAKVRDVPATMVNLAHRVQGIEVTLGIELAGARPQGSRIDKIEHALAALAAVFRR